MEASRVEEERRILLVDDEEALVWSLSTRLRKARKYSVDAAHSGENALIKLAEQPIDLLVADVRMPGMSGIDLVLAARQTSPDLAVIVMTAFKTPDVQRLSGGARISYLEKPFAFERFLEMVDLSLAEKKKAEELRRKAPTEPPSSPTTVSSGALGFYGAISVQALPDVVQLYVLSNSTGMLSIKHHSGEGSLWFDHGTIRHAVAPEKEGEAAFYEIMMWSGGEFSTRVGVRPPKVSISSSWQELLMESCRRIDERTRSEDARLSRTGWTLVPPPPSSSSSSGNPSSSRSSGATNTPDSGWPDESPENDPFAGLEMSLSERSPPNHPPPMAAPEDTQNNNALENKKMNIKESLSRLNSIDGFIGAALVDSESGMLLGQEGGSGINMEIAAAGNTEVVKAKRKTMNNLQLKDQIEDILITLGKHYHLIRPLRARSTLFFYIAVDRQRANLAMARIALADVERDLVV